MPFVSRITATAPARTIHRLGLLALLLLLPALAARATEIFSQPHNGTGTLHPASTMDPDGSDWDQFVWDSFEMPANQSITEIRWRGGFDPAPWGGGPVVNFQVAIFGNSGQLWEPDVVAGPLVEYDSGNACGQSYAGTFGGTTLYDYAFALPSPFPALGGTRYWINITAWQPSVPDWGFAAASGGNGSHVRLLYHVYQNVPGDLAFSLQTVDAPQATVTAEASPSGSGTIFGEGDYPVGSNCTLEATPAAGWGFDIWTLDGAEVSNDWRYTFPVDGDVHLVAQFVPSYTIATSAQPSMGGQTSGDGAYNAGSQVTVSAVPGLGHAFLRWLEWGSPTSTEAVYTFVAAANRTLTAQFTRAPEAAVFDFDTGSPPVQPWQQMPATQTNAGLTASFSSPLSSWSVQNSVNGFVPGTFSGNFLMPSGLFNNTLHLEFSDWLSDVSLAFSTGDLAGETDVPTQIRVRAYRLSEDEAPVATAQAGGDWITGVYPEGILALSSPEPFRLIVVDIPWQGPTTAPTFYADNFIALRTAAPTALVSAVAAPLEGGSVLGAGSLPVGSTVSLQAVASAGFVFSHWEENGLVVGGAPALEFVLVADRVLEAVFTPVLSILHDAAGDPDGVTLGWPAPSAAWTLNETADPASGLWTPVLEPVETVDGWNRVRVPLTEGTRVFRLLP